MLDHVKMLLGFQDDDQERDQKLKWIIDSAKARLKMILGGIDPPEEMNYIIVEVAIARFNRIGSEGLETHIVEGEHQLFKGSDFDGYSGEIQAYLDANAEKGKGRVRFL